MSVPLVELGDVCTTTQGVQITKANTSDELYNGGYRYLYIADFISDKKLSFVDDKFDAKKVTAHDLVMANTGSPGRVFKGKKGILSNNLFRITFDEKIVNRDYLYLILSSSVFQGHLQQQMKGGIQKHLGHKTISRQTVPLPSLVEQQKIAEILDAADSLKQKDQQLVEHYDSLSQSLFLDMFGDPVHNPKKWGKVDFASIGTLDRGKSKHRPRNDPTLLGGEHPLIQTGDVANSNGYLTTFKSTYSDLGLKQSKMWPAGTLCITIAANIAKTGILTFDACFPDSVVGFVNNDKSNIEYVKFWMSFLQKVLEDSAPMAAQKNINLKILRELEVSLPPIELQNLFEKRLIEIEKQKKLAQQSLQKSEDLFNSLLQRAFKGELTDS